MATLSIIEKFKLERLFQMGDGYVLDFTNQTFRELVLDSVGIDIYDEEYDYQSGSKANRLRAFWREESDYRVAKVISSLLEYWRETRSANESDISPKDRSLYHECCQIVQRLEQSSGVENIDALEACADDEDSSFLVQSILKSIESDEPQVALDRSHTLLVRYTRRLCDKYGLAYDRGIPLNGLFGMYVKQLVQSGRIRSQMTERILKSSISILDSFNKVRNDQSFAHDNPILNYPESQLILSNIASLIKFIESIESGSPEVPQQEDVISDWDELPF